MSVTSGSGGSDLTGRSLGPFRIESKLGEGGMGVVYRALDTRQGRAVALKVLAPQSVQDPDRRRRFLREARVASAVTHPNVAAVYEATEVDGQVVMAMELVRGDTLRARLEQGPLPLADAVLFTLAIARGLAKAHERGIVHRDLKPENVVVTWTRDVKVLDFGLAKLHEAEGSLIYDEATVSNASLEGKVTGTPGYMAPEQVTGKEVSFRTDVFTLGVVFYEMLTGVHPFRGDSVMDVLIACTRDEPRPARSVNPAVTPSIEAIVSRCMAKKPGDRFANAGEIVAAIEALEDVGSPRPRPRATRTRRATGATWALVAGGSLLVAVSVAGAARLLRSGSVAAAADSALAPLHEGPVAPALAAPVAAPPAAVSASPTEEVAATAPDAGPAPRRVAPPRAAPVPRTGRDAPRAALPPSAAPVASSAPAAPKSVERGTGDVPIVE